MGRSAAVISEKIMQLSEGQLAEVDRFVESLHLNEDAAFTKAAMAMSERSFDAVWNNPEDDVYDAL